MKKFLFVSLTGLLSLLSMQSYAQPDHKKFSFGFGFDVGKPLGSAKDAYNFTGGLDLRFSYKLGPGFATLSAGVNAFVPKSFSGKNTKAALQIPVKLGYKYKIVPHFFVMGEVGFSSFRSYYDGLDNKLVSTTSSGFTFAPSIGTEFGAFEAAIRYEGIAVSGGSVFFCRTATGI